MRFVLMLAAAIACAAPAVAQPLFAQRIAGGLSSPTNVATPPGDARLFITTRGGQILVLDDGAVLPSAFLDLSDQVDDEGEGGLLGLVFSPDYATDGFFYVYFTTGDPGVPNDLVAVLARFSASGDPATSNVADPQSEKVLFALAKDTAEHNGATVAIRDGFLYLAIGDGGGIGDPMDRAQDPSSPFGKMLRFDLSMSDPIPQIWARGFRNPFRFSFDAMTGDLYLGDVGLSDREEIDVAPAASEGGLNFGWDIEEGSLCFDPTPGLGELPCGDPGLTRPIYEYAHDPEAFCNAVTGGVVYRGTAIPDLYGVYLFGDFCTNQIWGLRWDGAGGTIGPVVEQQITVADGFTLDAFSAFAQDGAGEIVVVDLGGEVFRLLPEPDSAALAAAAALTLATLRARRAKRRSATAAAADRAIRPD